MKIVVHIQGNSEKTFASITEALSFARGRVYATQATADDLRIDVIWLFSEDEAISAANFIQHEIEDQDHCIYGD